MEGATNRVSLIVSLPVTVEKRLILLAVPRLEERLKQLNAGSDMRLLNGPGFVEIDFTTSWSDGFIEEMHAKGEPFEEAVLDAGIVRLRPVLITVGATVIALFPLAIHGGPLWEPSVTHRSWA